MIITRVDTAFTPCHAVCPSSYLRAVYVNDVLDLFGDSESQGLLLLVPVRLGSEALNPIYIPCVKVLKIYCNIYIMYIPSTLGRGYILYSSKKVKSRKA